MTSPVTEEQRWAARGEYPYDQWPSVEKLRAAIAGYAPRPGEVEVRPEPPLIPADSAVRKRTPMARGLLDYFPAALAAVAQVSFVGNEKHNPGQPLHWARDKSTDHADCILRHLAERGQRDPDTGLRHSAALAWRALALLQLELEAAGEVGVAITPIDVARKSE